MPGVVLLRVTKVTEHGKEKLSMNMPYIALENPRNLPVVANQSGEKIDLEFKNASPCDPPKITIRSRARKPLPWRPRVRERAYYYDVTVSKSIDGNVLPVNGTIDIVAGGGLED